MQMVGSKSVFFAALCLLGSVSGTSKAQAATSALQPAVAMQGAVQVQCEDFPYQSFGMMRQPMALSRQDVSCWLRKYRIKKIAETPFVEGLEFVRPRHDQARRDEAGFLPEDWLRLSDAEILAVYVTPKNVNYAIEMVQAGVTKGLVPYYLLGLAAVEEPHLLSDAFAIAYPDCGKADLAELQRQRCATGLSELRRRLTAAGFGKTIVHNNINWAWSSFARPIGNHPANWNFLRARWYKIRDGSVMTDKEGTDLIELARAGFAPAARLWFKLGNSCSGDQEVVAPMARGAGSLQQAADLAIKTGDADAAYSFAGFLREGSCGASRDRVAAANYLKKAADLGHPKAQRAMVDLYANGDGVARNPAEAARLLRLIEPTATAEIARLEASAKEFSRIAAIEGTITDVASTPPNIATIRAVMIRELKWSYQNFDGGMQSGLGEMFGVQTEWNEAEGIMRYRQGDRANFGTDSLQQFKVSAPKCTAVTTPSKGFSCRYTLSIFMDAMFGTSKVVDNFTSPIASFTDVFTFENGRWRSQSIRARMLSGLRSNPVSAGAASGGRSSLCRGLTAGVAAAGGRSTSRALDPNSWGC